MLLAGKSGGSDLDDSDSSGELGSQQPSADSAGFEDRLPGSTDIEKAMLYFQRDLLEDIPAEDFLLVCEGLAMPLRAVVFNAIETKERKIMYLNSLITKARAGTL